jgi:hypothetical protein
MNLIDAVKSGLPFRRKNQDWGWWKPKRPIDLGPGDILADDWEVQEEKIEVTARMVEEAYLTHTYRNADSLCDALWRKLKELANGK